MRNTDIKTHKELYRYWDKLHKNAAVPWRSDVVPAQLQAILPAVFIADICPQTGAKFRLVGQNINDFFTMDMRSAPVAKIAMGAAQDKLKQLIQSFFKAPTWLEVEFSSKMGLAQLTALPLRDDMGEITLMIGAFTCHNTAGLTVQCFDQISKYTETSLNAHIYTQQQPNMAQHQFSEQKPITWNGKNSKAAQKNERPYLRLIKSD